MRILKKCSLNALKLNFNTPKLYVFAMKLLLITVIISLNSYASILGIDHYPEDRVHTSNDLGMRSYRATSFYKTGTFSLTFYDGPHPTRTPRILDILKAYDVKATFFVLTSKVNPENFYLIKRMLDEGHVVASHGPSHDRSADLSKEEWKKQIRNSYLELAKWYKETGHEFNKFYYRFSYDDYVTRTDYHHLNALKEVSQELFKDNCIFMPFWDVDTSDWVPGMTPEEVAQNMIAFNEGGTYIDFKKVSNTYVKVPTVVKNPSAGGVILHHDVQGPSVKGLELFIQYALARGINLLPLDEVEEFRNVKNCKL